MKNRVRNNLGFKEKPEKKKYMFGLNSSQPGQNSGL